MACTSFGESLDGLRRRLEDVWERRELSIYLLKSRNFPTKLYSRRIGSTNAVAPPVAGDLIGPTVYTKVARARQAAQYFPMPEYCLTTLGCDEEEEDGKGCQEDEGKGV